MKKKKLKLKNKEIKNNQIVPEVIIDFIKEENNVRLYVSMNN